MTERVPHPVFTEEMRQTHTILFPDMVDIHFHLLENVLRQSGYRAALLTNEGPEVSRTGRSMCTMTLVIRRCSPSAR